MKRWKFVVAGGGLAGFLLNEKFHETTKNLLFQPKVALAKEKTTHKVPYVLIGSGTASYFAALTIRGREADSKILIIGDELHSCYNKTHLSKELWTSNSDAKDDESLTYLGYKGRKKHVTYEAEGFYVEPEKIEEFPHGCVSLIRGVKAVKIYPNQKKILLSNGDEVQYDKVLIATGSTPVSLPVLSAPELKDKVCNLSKIDDYIKLRKVAKAGAKIVVVDGGFLGSELSYSLKKAEKDVEVVQIVPEEFTLTKFLPKNVAKECTEKLDSSGVRVIKKAKIESAEKMPNGKVHLKISTGKGHITVIADFVVDGLRWKPNNEIAKNSGLEIDQVNQGIVANSEFQVRKDIYTAGDVASFYDINLGRLRIQHHEHAEISGRTAGENMTNGRKTLPRRAAFRSRIADDVFLEGVGKTDSHLKTVVFRATDQVNFPKWVTFYLENNKIVGVVTCNISFTAEYARKLIEDARPDLDLHEVAKLFSLYRVEKPESEEEQSADEH